MAHRQHYRSLSTVDIIYIKSTIYYIYHIYIPYTIYTIHQIYHIYYIYHIYTYTKSPIYHIHHIYQIYHIHIINTLYIIFGVFLACYAIASRDGRWYTGTSKTLSIVVGTPESTSSLPVPLSLPHSLLDMAISAYIPKIDEEALRTAFHAEAEDHEQLENANRRQAEKERFRQIWHLFLTHLEQDPRKTGSFWLQELPVLLREVSSFDEDILGFGALDGEEQFDFFAVAGEAEVDGNKYPSLSGMCKLSFFIIFFMFLLVLICIFGYLISDK
ncbi:Protein PBN1 [Caenorhabditis elegans]|uniref:Protein PBN1 n=1 Tax=Caenorhabditis elegans TaxID=6239 RepID=Q9N4H8_CAEEL|nr:Protein PBN1 [Caenorhabditis elegans]CCD73501.1 Protein PBN1 [Caenorhabditis elegans]|eukprot:NP_491068.1 Uncharacterized protein CELE_Y71F9AL.6 [Caenorhabditis elegans]